MWLQAYFWYLLKIKGWRDSKSRFWAECVWAESWMESAWTGQKYFYRKGVFVSGPFIKVSNWNCFGVAICIIVAKIKSPVGYGAGSPGTSCYGLGCSFMCAPSLIKPPHQVLRWLIRQLWNKDSAYRLQSYHLQSDIHLVMAFNGPKKRITTSMI